MPRNVTQNFRYDHRILRRRLPVRSALFKQDTGGLVVRWVITSESPLLYVFAISCAFALDLLSAATHAVAVNAVKQVSCGVGHKGKQYIVVMSVLVLLCCCGYLMYGHRYDLFT
jgi:hypothetical protein